MTIRKSIGIKMLALPINLTKEKKMFYSGSSRRNRSIKNVFGEPCTDKESLDQIEKKKKHQLEEFIKYLTHISANKDFKKIMINIDKIISNKDSLVHLLLYFEEHVSIVIIYQLNNLRVCNFK